MDLMGLVVTTLPLHGVAFFPEEPGVLPCMGYEQMACRERDGW